MCRCGVLVVSTTPIFMGGRGMMRDDLAISVWRMALLLFPCRAHVRAECLQAIYAAPLIGMGRAFFRVYNLAIRN